MAQLFDRLPLEITLHILCFLNPRDIVTLRRVNKAHHSLFISDLICRTALRIFFGQLWPSGPHSEQVHVQTNPSSARLLFDQIIHRCDNQRRGHFTKFHQLELQHSQTEIRRRRFGTDASGNAVLVTGHAVPSGDMESRGSFTVHWLEGGETLRDSMLRVYLDCENRVIRVLADHVTVTQAHQPDASKCPSEKEASTTRGFPHSTSSTAVLAAQCGKIVVREYLPGECTRLAVLDLEELRARSISSDLEHEDFPFPLQYVWDPEELFLKNSANQPSIFKKYLPPGFFEHRSHLQSVDVNAYYILYKDICMVENPDKSSRGCVVSEEVVVLPISASVTTVSKTLVDLRLWTSCAQRLSGITWKPRYHLSQYNITAVGADREGKLFFYCAVGSDEYLNPKGTRIQIYRLAEFGSKPRSGQASVKPVMIASIPLEDVYHLLPWTPSPHYVTRFPVMFVYPSMGEFCGSLVFFSSAIQLIANDTDEIHRDPQNPTQTLPTARVWSVSVTFPPHLKRPSRDRYVTVSVALMPDSPSKPMQHALVTNSYTLPSTEIELITFLSQAAGDHSACQRGAASARSWMPGHMDQEWSLRPDADGYALLLEDPPQCTWYIHLPTAQHRVLMRRTENALGHACPLPSTELHTWFSVGGLTYQPAHYAIDFSALPKKVTPSPVGLRIPVFCSTRMNRSSTSLCPLAGTDQAEMRQAATAMKTHTVSPWYMTLSLDNGTSKLPFSKEGIPWIRAVGDGWLVYQWSEERRSQYYWTVLVWFD
ncbi:hypothetical protein BDZ91DRAFT_766102 [Kalaharituber pfeilii]|nr:hypothetical protein BDZ91DRAFT_766102 [Kalaharituber pfeilii]